MILDGLNKAQSLRLFYNTAETWFGDRIHPSFSTASRDLSMTR